MSGLEEYRLNIGGLQAFNGDCIKYVEAKFPDDEESQDNYLMDSDIGKIHYSQLENLLLYKKENAGLFSDETVNLISLKIINILKGFI